MLVVMVGLPGSGKSTWAEASFRHVVSPDRIRRERHGTEFDPEVEDAVWRRAYAETRRLLAEGRVVCFDATSATLHRRRRLLELAAELEAPAVAVRMRVPEEVAWERNLRRARTVPRDAFEQLARALVPPTVEEGFAAVMEVDTGGR